MAFKKAERKQVKLKLALCGVSGGGKTYSALLLAKGLANGGKIAVVDTENESASLYAGSPGVPDFDTDVIRPPFFTDKYIAAIKEAEAAGYSVVVLDSITHQWNGEGGIMDRIDKEKIANPKMNSFTVWSKYTPEHERFKQAILQSDIHVICTMRSKTGYIIAENERGKAVPKRGSMESVQREGIDYEFTIVLDLEPEKHYATVNKDRTGLFDGQHFIPSEKDGQTLLDWMRSGKKEWRFGQKEIADLTLLCKSIGWDGVKMRAECKAMFEGRTEKQLSELEFTQFCHSIARRDVEAKQKDIEQKVDKLQEKIAEVKASGTIVSPEFDQACREAEEMMK